MPLAICLVFLPQAVGAQNTGVLPECPLSQPAGSWHECRGVMEDRNSGIKYMGDFRWGQFDGMGLLRSQEGSYTGNFRQGRMDGQGVFTTADNRRYVGEFRVGAMTGAGRLLDPQGREVFSGQFFEGQPQRLAPPQPLPQQGPGVPAIDTTAPGRMAQAPAMPAPVPIPAPMQTVPQALTAGPTSAPQAATANLGGAAPGIAAAPVQGGATPPVAPARQAEAFPPGPPAAAAQAPAPVRTASAVRAGRPERGFATGRITMPDGSPIPPSVERTQIWINGVSSAGRNVTYEPIIRPDGTYRQALAEGQYRFSKGFVTVRHQGRTFQRPLEPVGDLATRSRDAAEGMVQDFVWKVSGPTPNGLAQGPQPGNHTHWYGMRIATQPGGWRVDMTDQGHLVNMDRAPREIPEGTRITLRLRPLTPAFDGRPLSETTIERDIDRMSPEGRQTYRQSTTTFHNLPPADYELTGFATLPNGSRHTLVFRGTEANRLGFVREARVNAEWDQMLLTLGERTLGYYLEGTPPGK